jgi:hypothetical protein
MNFKFWNRKEDSMPPEDVDNIEETDETEEEDDLSDIDEDTKARIDKYTAKKEQEYQSKLTKAQESLRNIGLNLNDDGVSIGDLATASRYFAPLGNPAIPQQPVKQESQEEEEWVDPSYDPQKYEKKFKKAVAEEVSSLKEDNRLLREAFIEDKIDQAVVRVEAAVAKYAPLYAEILEHPQFEGSFREVLKTFPMEQWRDPRNLVKIVGMMGVDLPQEERKPKRDTTSTQEQARSIMQRETLRMTAPSRDASSAKGKQEYSDLDKETAALLGISIEQARALGTKADPDKGVSPEQLYREARAAANGRRK